MAMTLHVDVVSIEELLYSGLAECVIAPAIMGEVGIYPMHAPLLTRLKAGVVRIKIPFQEEEKIIYVSSGMLEVRSSVVTILSDIALDEAALAAGQLGAIAQKTEDTMKHILTDLEYAKLEIELMKSVSQLEGIQRWRQGKRGI